MLTLSKAPRFEGILLALLLAWPVAGHASDAPGAWPSTGATPVARADATDPDPAPSTWLPEDPTSLAGVLRGHDGGWHQLPPPGQEAPLTFYDAIRDRMIALDLAGALWTLALSGEPEWSPLLALGDLPPAGNRLAVHDAAGDRVLLLLPDAGMSVWELKLSPLPYWRRLETTGEAPSWRTESTLALDPVNGRLMLFGGVTDRICGHVDCLDLFTSQVWTLTLESPHTWQRLPDPDLRPAWMLARARARGVVDGQRQRLFVFGGRGYASIYGYESELKSDAWFLELGDQAVWRQVQPVGPAPPPGTVQATVLDAANDRVLALCHEAGSLTTWALSLGDAPTWTRLEVAPPIPPGRWTPGAVLDDARRRLVAFGGIARRHEVLFLELEGGLRWRSWIPALSPESEIHREFPGLLHDPVGDRLILYAGGYSQLSPTPAAWNDVRQLPLEPLGTWQVLPTQGTGPPYGLLRARTTYDMHRQRMLVAGGRGYTLGTPPYYDNDAVWALSLSGIPTWSRIATGGPGARNGNSATYDPVRDRLLVVGGFDGTLHHSDVWALELEGDPRWELLLPDDRGPAQLFDHSAIHDPIHNRLLIFGGSPYGSPNPGDLWALELAGEPRWARIEPPGDRPEPRRGHTAVLDLASERMLIFSGDTGSGCPENASYSTACNDVWAFDLRMDRWTKLRPTGPLPAGRFYHAAAFDPMGRRMFAVGGTANGGAPGHTWILDFNPRRLDVRIDVLPGSPRNPIAWRSRRVLPVAVFGSAAVPVNSLELSSLTLADAHVATLPHGDYHVRKKDLDGDGLLDATLHFDRESMAIDPRDAVIHLEGHLSNGLPVTGSDLVVVRPGDRQAFTEETESGVDEADAAVVLALDVASSRTAGLSATISMPAAAQGRLELFDLGGRRLQDREFRSSRAGEQLVLLAPPAALPSGVYFVRLTHLTRSLVRRVAVLR